VALISGIMITFVLQSSSACTVLLVGFVNSGLMTLAQTIGVILGADIGTTLTVQLIAFDVGQFALAFVFLGFVCIFFTKNPSVNYVGRILIGFGLLFYGLKVMGGSMKPLAKYPPFIDILQRSTSNPFTGLLVSTILTGIIQSSAATIAIALGLAMQVGPDGKPILSLVAAIPIIYGANIGTTITAALAAIGTTRDAKRVAVAHTLFKVVGVIIFMCLITPLNSVVLKWEAALPGRLPTLTLFLMWRWRCFFSLHPVFRGIDHEDSPGRRGERRGLQAQVLGFRSNPDARYRSGPRPRRRSSGWVRLPSG